MGASAFESALFLVDDPEFEPEQPRHRVTLDYSIAIGAHEVTVAEYSEFARSTNRKETSECGGIGLDSELVGIHDLASWETPGYYQTENMPVVCLSLEDAQDYTLWLSKKTGFTYRLPSESEWEYAAAGGSETRFFWGNRISVACRYANVADEMAVAHFNWDGKLMENFDCSDGHIGPAEAGREGVRANSFGLFDTIGNVAEMVLDCHFKNHDGAPVDGSARLTEKCQFRVEKGNAWGATPIGARTAFRSRYSPTRGDALRGLRVVREIH